MPRFPISVLANFLQSSALKPKFFRLSGALLLMLALAMQSDAWAAPSSLNTQGSQCGVTMSCPPPAVPAVPVGPPGCTVEAGGSTCPGQTGVASQGNQGGTSLGAGNPINIISGNKYQREDDMPALPGVLGLEIVRHYNSAYSTPDTTTGILGRGWKLSYETALYATGAVIQIIQADGSRVMFKRDPKQPGLCASTNPADGQLRITLTAQGDNYAWTWPNGKTLQFDHGGRLVQIAVPTGEFVSLQHDPKGVLVQVTDPQGRQLRLQYPTQKEAARRFRGVATIASPVGDFTYTYANATQKAPSTHANLVTVRYPAGKGSRHYHYEDALRPTFLTGTSIQASATSTLERTGTYLYNHDGRAILSARGVPARLQTGPDGKPLQRARLVPGTGTGQVTLDYATPGVTNLTNSFGQKTTYRHAIIGGEYRLLEARGAGCGQCGDMNMRYGYDDLGRQIIATQLTAAGEPQHTRRTDLDAQGRPVKVTSTRYEDGKVGTPQLLMRYEYAAQQSGDTSSPSFSMLPTVIARPSMVPGQEHRLMLAYNDKGQITRISETGFSPIGNIQATPLVHETLYRYQTINGRSLLAEVDGPLKNGPTNSPADSDITRYSWNQDGSVIRQITHPTGLVAQFNYEPDQATTGMRITRSTGIDGVVTAFVYDAGGALTQINRAGAITHYRRDAAGRTTQVTSPIGETLQFDFKNGRDLATIQDRQNNRIELLRDTEGELKEARLLDPSGTLAQQPKRYVLPSAEKSGTSQDPVLADLRALITAAQTADNANIVRPEPIAPFFMLQAFMAAAESTVHTGSRNAMSQAVDAKGLATTYLADDFGNMVQVQSPTTGTTTYLYDSANRLVGKRSEDGSRVAYQRDAAGRITTVQAHNAANILEENASIEWGKANKPVAIKYLAGAEYFAYDAAARLVEHTQHVDTKRMRLQYRYNIAGQTIAKTLPDGQELRYRYRGSQHPRAGLLESVWLAGVIERPIIQGMNGEADRYSRQTFTFGNGLTNERLLDEQGRVIKAGNAQVGQTILHYDPLVNVRPDDPAAIAYAKANAERDGKALTDPTKVTVARPILLGQHAQEQAAQALISRLHGMSAGWQDTMPSPLENGTPPNVWSATIATRYDALGRQIQQGTTHYTFNSLNRLTGIDRSIDPGVGNTDSTDNTKQEVARYRYNLFGQRISKTVASTNGTGTKTTHYFYDGSTLAFEAGDTHASAKQYVWLNDKPVAMLRGGGIFSIHTDHRQAPLAATNEAREVVWQATVTDYLNSGPVQGKSLGNVTLNLRGSNQYFDAESGLHYNTQRYFDPVYARYLTPDPLGLAVGSDLYAFALGRPHTMSDPLGLAPVAGTDWSKASYTDKLAEIVKRAAPQVPGEIGAALQEMVQPENLAIMGAIFGVWAYAQTTPLGWIADVAILGLSFNAIGMGVIDLFDGLMALHNGAKNETCEAGLDHAAQMLANKLVAAAGGIGGGAGGIGGLAKTGGATRIAKGIKEVVAYGKPSFRQTANADTSAVSTANALRLRTQLAFQEAGVLDAQLRLTPQAIARSDLIRLEGGVIKNKEITQILTRDGSAIKDWNKFTTESVKMPNNQSMQIHYYKNVHTGKIDYITYDFKVKGIVKQ